MHCFREGKDWKYKNFFKQREFNYRIELDLNRIGWRFISQLLSLFNDNCWLCDIIKKKYELNPPNLRRNINKRFLQQTNWHSVVLSKIHSRFGRRNDRKILVFTDTKIYRCFTISCGFNIITYITYMQYLRRAQEC